MSDYSVTALSKYTTPEIVEVRNKEWIEYGEDNNYFQYLIDRYTGSTTNNSIINGISNQIYGKGIGATDANRRPDQYAQMLSLFSKIDLKRFIKDKKMLGMSSWQVSYEKNKVALVSHFPMNTLRPEKKNKDGEVEAWYYHPNWKERQQSEIPLRIPAFGFGNKKGNEMFVLTSYVAGCDYFSPVDYVGALPYAVLEEEIADYLINDTINGFSGTKVVNFNNGVPDDEEKREAVKRNVLTKLTGARGEKVIIAFNDNKENATTVEDLPLNDAPAHYEYLSKECRDKLIVGHRVTSPMLIGVREAGGGLGNNADEIKTASLLFDNITINSMQEEVTDAMDAILAVNDITLNLYFKTLQPLEFIDTDGMKQDAKEEATGDVAMCSHKFSKDNDNQVAQELIDLGEDLSDEWELIDETPVDYENEERLDAELEVLNNPKLSFVEKLYNLVSTGSAKPDEKSSQDRALFKVRYQYAPLSVGSDSREFCQKMVGAKKVYRKEDIVAMKKSVVNAGWGLEGADKYDIWLYKGGGDCHHFWMRKTYKRKRSGGKFLPNKGLVNDKEVSVNSAKRDGFTPVVNDIKVATRPTDMPNNGFVNK